MRKCDVRKMTLVEAVQLNDLEEVKTAWSNSHSVKKSDPWAHESDLGEAVVTAGKQGSVEILKWFLENGVNSNTKDIHGNTVLILTAECGKTDVVKTLIEYSCDVDSTDWQGRTALHWAAMNGHTEIVRHLIAAGALVNSADTFYKFTPVMLSSRIGHADIVDMLVKSGADTEKTDSHGETAVFDAVRNKNNHCVALLLAARVQINFCDGQMRTPLMVSVMWDNYEGSKSLVRANCDLEIPGQFTLYFNRSVAGSYKEALCTPLEVAVLECKFKQAKLLMTAGSQRSHLRKWLNSNWAVVNLIEQEDIDWLNEIISHPVSLKETCRTVVRRCLGPYIEDQVLCLPVPRFIQDYIYNSVIQCS